MEDIDGQPRNVGKESDDDDDDDQEEDIEKQIAKEMSGMKRPRKEARLGMCSLLIP